MSETIKLQAFLIANQLDIRGIRAFYKVKPLAGSSSELFYGFSPGRYTYFFNYGVVTFANFSAEEVNRVLTEIHDFIKGKWLHPVEDQFFVSSGKTTETIFHFNEIVMGQINEKSLRIVMLAFSQSMALDLYRHQTEALLDQLKNFTTQMVNTGKLNVSRKKLMKFVGKALETQNNIADNIYVFDTPDMAWDDEYLDQINRGLRTQFDLRIRLNEVEYMLKTISGNLSVFTEITHHRESSALEWTIIVLILVEIVDMIVSKIG